MFFIFILLQTQLSITRQIYLQSSFLFYVTVYFPCKSYSLNVRLCRLSVEFLFFYIPSVKRCEVFTHMTSIYCHLSLCVRVHRPTFYHIQNTFRKNKEKKNRKHFCVYYEKTLRYFFFSLLIHAVTSCNQSIFNTFIRSYII